MIQTVCNHNNEYYYDKVYLLFRIGFLFFLVDFLETITLHLDLRKDFK